MTPDPARRRLRVLRGARTRILAGIVIVLVLSEGATLLGERQLLQSRAGERVENALVQEVDEFRTLVRLGRNPNTGEPFGRNVRAIFDVFLSRNVPAEGEAVFTYLRGEPHRSTVGQPRSGRLAGELERLGDVTRTTRGAVETADGPVRYLAVPVVVEGERRGTFVITGDLGQEEAEIAEAIRIAAIVSLAVLLAASLLAWVVAGRVLAPLRELTDTARAISESDLTRRIDVQSDDEIGELARTFNAMLDRLEAAFGSQRAFVSDAGHELRTPITIIRGHLELLGDDPAERAETVALVTDELDRMARFVEDLLTLAKAERTDFLRVEDLDVDVLSEELLAKAAALGPRSWRLEKVATGRITADRQRLTQAVMNLASNAVQHTAPGDAIELGSSMANGHARLWVRDHGPGVAAEDRARIFDRFARAGGVPRSSEGAGLGLAIVRAIAEAHGGRVELQSSGRPGAGAIFTIVIPTDPPQEVAAP